MKWSRSIAAVLMLATASCSDGLVHPHRPDQLRPQLHQTSLNCPLAQLPASAVVVTCFNFTLEPGVWHGFQLELSTAQPPGEVNGGLDRVRLNHPYVLALPEGYRKLGLTEPGTPGESAFAFQAEWNGTHWLDVLRLHTSVNGPPQNVPIVVFWANTPEIGNDIIGTIEGLRSSGAVNRGQANALTRKIEQALRLMAGEKQAAALAVLEGFIQQVEELLADGILSAAQGAQLTSWVQYMISFM